MATLLQRERTMSNEMHFYLHSIIHKASQSGAECYSWYFFGGVGTGMSFCSRVHDHRQHRHPEPAHIASRRYIRPRSATPPAALFAALDPTFFFLNIAAAVRGFSAYFSFPFQHWTRSTSPSTSCIARTAAYLPSPKRSLDAFITSPQLFSSIHNFRAVTTAGRRVRRGWPGARRGRGPRPGA